MTSIQVFIGDITLNIPIHLNKRISDSYSASWLIDTTLDVLKKSQRNICNSITVMDIKTKCCGLSIMPHTKLKDLYINHHLPDIEIFVSVDTFLSLSSWQKLCHLGFQVTNTQKVQNKTEQDMDEESTDCMDNEMEHCEICGHFEWNLCSIKLDFTIKDIIDHCDIGEDIINENNDNDSEELQISKVDVIGNFTEWKNWISLKSKRIKGAQHWIKVQFLSNF